MPTKAFPAMDLETRKLARQIQKLKRDVKDHKVSIKKLKNETKNHKAQLNRLAKKIKSRR